MLLLNNRFLSIIFTLTLAIGNNEQLVFVGVLVVRNCIKNLKFDIFRKETHPINEFLITHIGQHKMVVLTFSSIYIVSFPLNSKRLGKERSCHQTNSKVVSDGYFKQKPEKSYTG